VPVLRGLRSCSRGNATRTPSTWCLVWRATASRRRQKGGGQTDIMARGAQSLLYPRCRPHGGGAMAWQSFVSMQWPQQAEQRAPSPTRCGTSRSETNIQTHTFMRLQMRTHKLIEKRACNAYTRMHAYERSLTQIHTHTGTFTHTYTHTRTHTHTHAHTHTHTRTHTHTHTRRS